MDTSKLKLNAETLRRLLEVETDQVAGGASSDCALDRVKQMTM